MVPMFMLKFGVAGLGAYTYLKRYSAGRNYAVIGACLYALSGFTVYNTFFNHFVDCIALFPFLLWALDSYVYDGVRGVFPLAVAVNLLNTSDYETTRATLDHSFAQWRPTSRPGSSNRN